MRSAVSTLAVVAILLAACTLTSAQIFRVEGGSSTLFGANGANVDIKAPTFDSQIGAGFLNGHFQYGLLVRTKLFGDTLSVGDDNVKIELPTDVFDSSHYFQARGVGLQHLMPKGKGMWYAFAGTTSLGYSSPFFMAARSQSGLGILYYERQLNGKLRFSSRNLFSDRQTSIQALEYTVTHGVKLSASAGLGSNQPYFATAASIERENFALRTAYIGQGEKFQRMQVTAPISTEPEKANIAAVYRIKKVLTLRGSHENILQPATINQTTLHASVNEAYATLDIARFNLGGGIIDSRFAQRGNLGINFYGTRYINRIFSVNGNFYQSRPTAGDVSTALTGTVREQLNQKLALTQTLIRSNGQTTASFGGEFVGNRLNASVGYQTVYVPFRPEDAFQQALSFNLRVNLPRNMHLTAGSFIDPEGKVRYSVGVGTYLYRVKGMVGGGPSPTSFRFPKFVVEGIVADADGNPVEGAAIHVDGQAAYSDSEGHFMIRLAKAGPHAVVVALDEFMISGNWEVIDAPASVTAHGEDDSTPIRIIIRRIRAKTP